MAGRKPKEGRGGARSGAGRKQRFPGETVAIQFRCPADKETEFRKYCNDKLDSYIEDKSQSKAKNK